MHAFYHTVGFEDEMFVAAGIFTTAQSSPARAKFSALSRRKMKQDLVEEPVFTQSTDIH